MPASLRRTLLTAMAGLAVASASSYTLQDDYSADTFFDMFDFSNGEGANGTDSAHGTVQYVDRSTAQSSGLISTQNASIYVSADSTHIYYTGRPSVRLQSKARYDHGLFIADVAHMPGGMCGVWPALWTYGPNWPNAGAINIIEQTNMATNNIMSLHTANDCSVTGQGASGPAFGKNCSASANNNQGCGYTAGNGTFGASVNAQGGGVYAMEWTNERISIWFFPRAAIPTNVLSATPDPSTWGVPVANFQGACYIPTVFRQHQIVLDIDFCGDFGNAMWESSQCQANTRQTCADYVNSNPTAFEEAYWRFNSFKVFQSQEVLSFYNHLNASRYSPSSRPSLNTSFPTSARWRSNSSYYGVSLSSANSSQAGPYSFHNATSNSSLATSVQSALSLPQTGSVEETELTHTCITVNYWTLSGCKTGFFGSVILAGSGNKTIAAALGGGAPASVNNATLVASNSSLAASNASVSANGASSVGGLTVTGSKLSGSGSGSGLTSYSCSNGNCGGGASLAAVQGTIVQVSHGVSTANGSQAASLPVLAVGPATPQGFLDINGEGSSGGTGISNSSSGQQAVGAQGESGNTGSTGGVVNNDQGLNDGNQAGSAPTTTTTVIVPATVYAPGGTSSPMISNGQSQSGSSGNTQGSSNNPPSSNPPPSSPPASNPPPSNPPTSNNPLSGGSSVSGGPGGPSGSLVSTGSTAAIDSSTSSNSTVSSGSGFSSSISGTPGTSEKQTSTSGSGAFIKDKQKQVVTPPSTSGETQPGSSGSGASQSGAYNLGTSSGTSVFAASNASSSGSQESKNVIVQSNKMPIMTNTTSTVNNVNIGAPVTNTINNINASIASTTVNVNTNLTTNLTTSDPPSQAANLSTSDPASQAANPTSDPPSQASNGPLWQPDPVTATDDSPVDLGGNAKLVVGGYNTTIETNRTWTYHFHNSTNSTGPPTWVHANRARLRRRS